MGWRRSSLSAAAVVLTLSLYLFQGPVHAQPAASEAADAGAVAGGGSAAQATSMTRGEFALSLARWLRLPDPGGPVDAMRGLQAQGIVSGFPDGSLGEALPIRAGEAVVLVGRALGFPEKVPAPAGGSAPSGVGHWSDTLRSWLEQAGLPGPSPDPERVLTAQEANAFLERVFGSDREALALMRRVAEQEQELKTYRFRGTYALAVDLPLSLEEGGGPGAVAEAPAGPTAFRAEMSLSGEVALPEGLHMTATVHLPEGVPAGEEDLSSTVSMEEYMVRDGLYVKLEDPQEGSRWMRMSLPGLDLEELTRRSTTMNLEPEMLELFHYRLLGEERVEGRRAQRIAFYGRMTLRQLMERLASILPEGNVFGGSEDLVPGGLADNAAFSFHGITVVDPEAMVTNQVEVTVVGSLSLRQMMEGMAAEMPEGVGAASGPETLGFRAEMRFQTFDHGDEGIRVELPLEAAGAEEVLTGATTSRS
ncbi:MAG: hypothetical protein IRY95_08600 [Clostridia bacterium]|nr:hypothetical protein [Clostridia bacterium]